MVHVRGSNWSEKDKEFIRESVGTGMTLEAMAKHVHRSPMAVRLLILRNKWTARSVVKHNSLIRLLKVRFNHLEDFQPSRQFYNSVRMSQKRFWQIYRGEKVITNEEYLAIARYLDVEPVEAFDAFQLELFEEYDK